MAKFVVTTENEELFYDFILNGYDNMQLEQEYDGVKLNTIQIHTLIMVDKNPGINVTDISRMWGHTRSAASKNISRLAADGFIEKRKISGNDKEIRLFATEKGQRAARQHIAYDRQAIDTLVNGVSRNCTSEEMSAFFKVMRYLNKGIKGEK